MPDRINVALPPRNDANDGAIETNPPDIGNRTYGKATFLTGATRPIPVATEDIAWTDFESLTVSSTALQITEALRDNDAAFITCEAQIVRYRTDGGIPTATVGHRLLVNDILKLKGKGELENFRVIRQDGADATLRVSVGSRA